MHPLIPIFMKIGAPLLVDVLKTAAPEPIREVVGAVAGALGVAPDERVIAGAIRADPDTAATAVRSVEEANRARWQYLAIKGEAQAELLAREDGRESALSWGWRPAMSWLLMFLWLWNGVLLPVANAFGAGLAPIPWEQLIGFSGLWLAIYGGGHTIKEVWGRK